MRLIRVRLHNVGVFRDTTVHLVDGAGPADDAEDATQARSPRPVTVLFGKGGVGKTTLLSSLAVTRPGYATSPPPYPRSLSTPGSASDGAEVPPFVVTEWLLGDDDPERPHPLVVASPSALLEDESTEIASARRREQALFDRRSQSEGGYVFVGFSGARWFSRTANLLTTPERSILRHDVRSPPSFDDPTRADLTRETKQVLAYAGVARALAAGRPEYTQVVRFDAALREVINVLLAPFGCSHAGVSPTALEPEFVDSSGRVIGFDALPRPARHLVAFGALSLRALFSAYPGSEAPRECEGVVAIDDVEAQQDPALLRGLVPLLHRALPNVQWILTTGSSQLAMACAPAEVVVLRRSGATAIEVGEGVLH